MSATRLQHGPNFLSLCICWQVWALLALSNKLDSGYFPNCLLRKVVAHPRVFCSWLWLMGILLRIIVLEKDAFSANAAVSVRVRDRGAQRHTTANKAILPLRLGVRICVQLVFTLATALLLEDWKARWELFVRCRWQRTSAAAVLSLFPFIAKCFKANPVMSSAVQPSQDVFNASTSALMSRPRAVSRCLKWTPPRLRTTSGLLSCHVLCGGGGRFRFHKAFLVPSWLELKSPRYYSRVGYSVTIQ